MTSLQLVQRYFSTNRFSWAFRIKGINNGPPRVCRSWQGVDHFASESHLALDQPLSLKSCKLQWPLVNMNDNTKTMKHEKNMEEMFLIEKLHQPELNGVSSEFPYYFASFGNWHPLGFGHRNPGLPARCEPQHWDHHPPKPGLSVVISIDEDPLGVDVYIILWKYDVCFL